LLNPNTIERKSVMNRLSLLLLISLCIYTGAASAVNSTGAASAVNSLATPEQTCQLLGSEGLDTVRLEGQQGRVRRVQLHDIALRVRSSGTLWHTQQHRVLCHP